MSLLLVQIRENYVRDISNASNTALEVLDDLDAKLAAGTITQAEYAQRLRTLSNYASQLRNGMLQLTRWKLSKPALAFSTWLKEQGLRFEQVLDLYAERRGWGKFATATEAQQAQIYRTIIQRSGVANVKVTSMSRALGFLGPVSLVVMIGISVWHIVESAHPALAALETLLDTAASVGGAIAGEALGAAIGSLGGPVGERNRRMHVTAAACMLPLTAICPAAVTHGEWGLSIMCITEGR
jgi:hypothetical protein